jgi:hypothetical protein
VFLVRDESRYKLAQLFHAEQDKKVFDETVNKELFIGYTSKDNTVINKAIKLSKKFKPMRPIIHYGYCKKFDFKPISFIPGVLQLETQHCFVHRKSSAVTAE